MPAKGQDVAAVTERSERREVMDRDSERRQFRVEGARRPTVRQECEIEPLPIDVTHDLHEHRLRTTPVHGPDEVEDPNPAALEGPCGDLSGRVGCFPTGASLRMRRRGRGIRHPGTIGDPDVRRQAIASIFLSARRPGSR